MKVFYRFWIKKNNPIFFIQIDTLPHYSEGFTILNSPDSLVLKEIVISKKYDIRLFTYEFMPSDYNLFHEEYIAVQNVNISIDSLLNAEQNEIIDYNPYISWQDVSYFSDNKYNYILVSGESRNFYMNGMISSYLLFSFTDKQFNNVWLFYNGYDSKFVFNDFDGDGMLDYLKWSQNKSEIDLFHFINNTLVKDTTYYIIADPSKDQIEDQKKGMFTWYTDIDKEKSKWFYPLN